MRVHGAEAVAQDCIRSLGHYALSPIRRHHDPTKLKTAVTRLAVMIVDHSDEGAVMMDDCPHTVRDPSTGERSFDPRGSFGDCACGRKIPEAHCLRVTICRV